MEFLWFVLPFLIVLSGGAPDDSGLPPLDPPQRVRQLWSHTVGGASVPEEASGLRPYWVRGLVFAASAEGALVSLDARDGREIWRVDVGKPVTAGVSGDGGRVVLAAGDEVRTFDADTGKPLWSVKVEGEVRAQPLFFHYYRYAVDPEWGGRPSLQDHHMLTVVKSMTGVVTAMESAQTLWRYRHPADRPAAESDGSALDAARDALLVGFPDGDLVALDILDGAPLWRLTALPPEAAPATLAPADRMTSLLAPPAPAGPSFCHAARRDDCAGLKRALASVADTMTMGTLDYGRGSEVRFDDPMSLTDAEGVIRQFSRETGRLQWTQDALRGRQPTPPAAGAPTALIALPYEYNIPVPSDGSLAVGDAAGFVHLLDRETGALRGRFKIGDTPIDAAPRWIQPPSASWLLVQTRDGRVHLLETRPPR
ncbi:MAG: PQQ-binding-like beta-propeller repeat protein [Zoogloeaceae bacterium]|jgi:outer membrane protein assembly factor BamB|nr:PQQ-binding-like beta-propeller repeat protein [Zoogloeaceae bacterium]